MAATAVDMNGWDTVAAITYEDVNAAIALKKTWPATFSQAFPDNSASASGTFGPWSLTTGGAGPLIKLLIPITGGTFKSGNTSTPLTACAATVEVQAAFLAQVADPQSKDLKLITQPTGSLTKVATVMDLEPKQSSPLADAVFKQLLENWFNANLIQFDHVFVTVDFDTELLADGIKWLAPSFQGYAVAEPGIGATLQNSVFAVLTLIDGDKPPSILDLQVSPYAIPANARAAFLISAEKFLQHMMLQATPMMFKDNPDPSTNFIIDNDGKRIRNTQSLTLTATQLDSGKIVNPTVDPSNFTIEVDETELAIKITDMTFTYSPGITVHLNYHGTSILSYDAPNGILDLTVQDQGGDGSVEVSEAINAVEIALGVFALVATVVGAGFGAVSRIATKAVATATTAGIDAAEAVTVDLNAQAQVTVTCCRGIVSGSVTEVSNLAARFTSIAKVAAICAFCCGVPAAIMPIVSAVASNNYRGMPKITDLTDTALGKIVKWPAGVPGFTLSTAQLNGCLQFGFVKSA